MTSTRKMLSRDWLGTWLQALRYHDCCTYVCARWWGPPWGVHGYRLSMFCEHAIDFYLRLRLSRVWGWIQASRINSTHQSSAYTHINSPKSLHNTTSNHHVSYFDHRCGAGEHQDSRCHHPLALRSSCREEPFHQRQSILPEPR